MARDIKKRFLQTLKERYGSIRKLPNTQSLYEVGDRGAIVYIRYSKLHSRNQSFYGLRSKDLQILEGRPAVLCFLWEGQSDPLLIPFSEYEEVFHSVEPADDGQYKAQVYVGEQGIEFYLAKAGRFNVESHIGWNAVDSMIVQEERQKIPDLSHLQVQTLLGAIGDLKGYDIWIPSMDRSKLDWQIAARFDSRVELPAAPVSLGYVLQEVDVVWIERGSSEMKALFEVEHSTPIYSGLLRFNDIHLVSPRMHTRYSIVANDVRRSVFVRQLNRPTFRRSGLAELCTFLEYRDVFMWYNRTSRSSQRN